MPVQTKHFLSAALAALALTGAGQASTAGEIYGERALALAIDDRCQLFTDRERMALNAARLQARGTLLREGVSTAALDDYTEDLHAQAARTACDLPEVADLRQRVGEAFLAWQTIRDMDFPGGQYDWHATRSIMPGAPHWAVRQTAGAMTLGLSRDNGDYRFSAALPAIPGAASAVLVTRDTGQAPDLYDPTMDGHFPAPEGAEWADWTPPGFARSVVWTSGQGDQAEREGLGGEENSLVFHFSNRASDQLSTLDPREAALIEVLGRDGAVLARFFFEVGDFAAARAFIDGGVPLMPRS
ncbi:hypothetical protein [Maricaulis parjimensis]|uniref:hypothetical protein n=1 Tax=Maricaulis parjimensis TaxID=144023 RepID=UPI00193A2322|nr:hypothetical protein [Maricaulis parjimensis]